jgi:hypothetical protein
VSDVPRSGEAFVITGLPEPPAAAPREAGSMPLPGSGGPGETGDDGPEDEVGGSGPGRPGWWERLGDRRATAVTAGVAGLVLLGVLLVMAMVTDGITFTSQDTRPSEGSTADAGVPGGGSPGEAVPLPPAPSEEHTAAPPQAADTPPSSDLPGTGEGATADDDEDDHDDDEDDDHEEDEDEDDDDHDDEDEDEDDD